MLWLRRSFIPIGTEGLIHTLESRAEKHVIILGAGLSGLAAAHDLLKAGHRVTVMDGMKDFGGLASSVRIEGQWVERFYHFICRNDTHLVELVHELGLERSLE